MIGQENISDKIGVETTCELKKDNEKTWTCEFTGLPEYYKGKPITYSVEEDLNSIPYEYSRGNVDVSTENGINTVTITNNYTPQLINIKGTKIWEDASDQDGVRPDSITINLMIEDEEGNKTPVLDEEGNAIFKVIKPDENGSWPTFSFDNLPETNGGETINYVLAEEAVDGYTADIVPGENYEVTITNTHVLERVSFHIEKIWSDGENQDGIRPESITVRLMKVTGYDEGGKEVLTQVREAVLSEDNDWTCEFGVDDDILYKNENGKPIIYRIVEDEVEGYEPVITSKDNEDENSNMSYHDITNNHTPEEAEIVITKTWNDADDILEIRPDSILVDILADGDVVMTVELTEDNDWTLVVEGLPKFADGVEIVYTLYEHPVEGYTTKYNGFEIINDLIPPKGGDVEELPPQTGIDTRVNINYEILGLIALMIITLRKIFG